MKINCKCGNHIEFGESPNANEWLLVNDVKFDTFRGDEPIIQYYNDMDSILKCSQCERLWVFWNGYKQAPTCYKPEFIGKN